MQKHYSFLRIMEFFVSPVVYTHIFGSKEKYIKIYSIYVKLYKNQYHPQHKQHPEQS